MHAIAELLVTFSQPTPFRLPTLPRISSSTRPDPSDFGAIQIMYLLTYLQFNRILDSEKTAAERKKRTFVLRVGNLTRLSRE